MHRTVFGSFSSIIGLKPTTASLIVFQITVIFRSLTRDNQDSKQRNAKRALIKLLLCRHKFCGCEVSLYKVRRFVERTKLFSEAFRIK